MGTALRRAGSTFIDFLFNPWVTFLCLTGLVLGGLVFPPQGISPPNCSMLLSAGVPCPTCGLTRSTTCVLRGEFGGAWQYNPFGFWVATGFVLLGPISLMPTTWRHRLRERVRPAGAAVMIACLVLAGGLMVHGVARILAVAGGKPEVQWWVNGRNPPAMAHYPAPEMPGLLAWVRLVGTSKAAADDAVEGDRP